MADAVSHPEAEDAEAAALEAGRLLFAQQCRFVAGVVRVAGLPPDALPEVAFAGRSNVGKSSLINALTGRKALARTSNTPGRTQQVNFFDLGGRLVSGRSAGLWLRPGVEGQGAALERADPRLPARAGRACAGSAC